MAAIDAASMPWKYVLPGGLVGLVVVLVALNIAIREDPEPDLTDLDAADQNDPELSDAQPPEPEPSDPERDETSATPHVVPEQTPKLAEDSLAAPHFDEGEAAMQPGGCDLPLIPAAQGQWRRYRWAVSDQEQVAVLRIEARSTRRLDDEQRQVRWEVGVRSEDGEMEPVQMTSTTRCRPGIDSEDPWFGILEVLGLGVRFVEAPGRWRWPAELAPGLRFAGMTRFDPRDADARFPEGVAGPATLEVRRRHIVDGRESVRVPAGRFTAWRVDYEERQSFGDHGETGTGTLWVASGAGLIKSRAENSAGVVQTLELTGRGD